MTGIGKPRHRGTVQYRDDRLTVSGPGLDRTVAAAVIGEIYRCTMEDEVHHGDEGFHILILADTAPDDVVPDDRGPDSMAPGDTSPSDLAPSDMARHDAFLLIGPFVADGLGAIEALTAAHPEIPVTPVRVRTVPYGFREPGFLGLRLFPVPGLRTGSRADLKRFHLVPVEAPNGGPTQPPAAVPAGAVE